MRTQEAWVSLVDCTSSLKEGDLQKVFDNWHGSKNGWETVGAPQWLCDCKCPNAARQFATAGYEPYRFIPDVLWSQGCFLVIELKRSQKVQSNALAEVLHHAWQLGDPKVLGRPTEQHPTPVIVTSSNSWLRSALCYLFSHGLRKDALKCLEVRFFKAPNGACFLYFREPFADRIPEPEAPPCIPRSWLSDQIRWYRIHGSPSWIGTAGEIPKHPSVIPDACVAVSLVNGQGEDRCVVYVRTPKQAKSTYWLASADPNVSRSEFSGPGCPF